MTSFQEIINLSRLQDSDPLQVATELHINDLVREAVDQCETTSEARNIWVTITEGPDATVLGDREQLIMAIHNLIENAINYSPEGTQVSITEKCQNNLIEIAVTDQGIGIPEKDLERIFERFYRADPSRVRVDGEGSGLGLSIVDAVMAAHGGTVTVQSELGKGATFTLFFPLEK